MQGGAAEHDHLLRAQQRQRQRVQRIGRGRGSRLGHGRQRGQLGLLAGAVTGDDHRVQAQVDVQRLVEADRRGVRPRFAVRAALRGAAGIGIGHQRFAQRDVEVHRPGVGAAGTCSGDEYPAGGRPPRRVERVHPLRRVLGQPEADRGADLGAEVAQLLHGLVGAGAEQLVGPVGRQHDQRHPRVVGLHHGRTQVGHRGARRHRHAHRRACGDRQPDRQIAGGPLVDAHVEPDPAGPVGVLQRKRQRGIT